MNQVHLLPWNFRSSTLGSYFLSISSFAFLPSLVFCFHQPCCVTIHPRTFLPQPSSTSSIARSRYMTAGTVGDLPHTRKSGQYDDLLEFRLEKEEEEQSSPSPVFRARVVRRIVVISCLRARVVGRIVASLVYRSRVIGRMVFISCLPCKSSRKNGRHLLFTAQE